jgi:secreted trypsin-like serine protease
MPLTGRRFCLTALAVAYAITLSPRPVFAQATAIFRVDLSSEGNVHAGNSQPMRDLVSDTQHLNLNANGPESDDCYPGDGRTSAAQASGERKIISQTDDQVIVELSSRSFARGGHIRKCASCPVKHTCIGISGQDTNSDANSVTSSNINIRVDSPLKKFRYDLFVGHVDTDGKIELSVKAADGTQLSEIPNHPSHYLVTENTRNVSVQAKAATEATDSGGCCSKTDKVEGVVTVSFEPAAELNANSFKPFIAPGRRTTAYPYVVALGLNGQITCTGTYVGGHTVVTAAHCVFPVKNTYKKKDQLDVRFGSSFDSPDQTLSVDAIDIPSDPAAGFSFNPETFEDDIAIVTFKGDTTVKPADLYTGAPPWSTIVDRKLPVEIVGFGFSVLDHEKVGIGFKREAAISVARFENRKLYFGAQAANTCDGDSGGPLFVETADSKTLLLAGVTSEGDDRCEYGIDTRVDAFLGWVKPRIK